MKIILISVILLIMVIGYWIQAKLEPEWRQLVHESGGYRASIYYKDSRTKWERLKDKIKHRDMDYEMAPVFRVDYNEDSGIALAVLSRNTEAEIDEVATSVILNDLIIEELK